ncbi:MAG: DUF5655 domain-containing protein [Bacteroidota bacterium]
MWTCPKCNRKFKSSNQHHICTTKDTGELFLDKSDELVVTFDSIMTAVLEWQPNYMGASTKSVVFTNKKAWLIIRPMKKELDVKFYNFERVDSELIKKYAKYPNKYAHHIRVASENEITSGFIDLLKIG